MLDKSRRDVNYSANKNLQDMIRWSIIMENHEDLIFMMHYVAKYFIQNPEWNFDHSIFDNETHRWESELNWFKPEIGKLWNLWVKDKWILNTNIPNRKKDLKTLPAWTRPKNWKLPQNFDDNELNLKLEARLLENYKFSVEQVSSGIECLKKVAEEIRNEECIKTLAELEKWDKSCSFNDS